MLSGAVPKNAKYQSGALPVGIDSRRRTIRLLPQNGSGPYSFHGSNVVRIDIPPSVGFLDTQNSYLKFQVRIKGLGSTNDVPIATTVGFAMDKNCMSWCRRFELISNNGSVLESIDDYNLLVNLLHTATSPNDYKETTGKLLDNQGDFTERCANMAYTNGRGYVSGIDASGILGGNSKYFPCQFIQGSITMEFQLASIEECFKCFQDRGKGQFDYEINNIEYVAEAINFGMDFNQAFEQELRTRGVDLHFSSYRSHHHTLTGTAPKVIQISQNSKSVKGVYTVIRDKEKYRSSHYDSLSTYKSGNLKEFFYDLGGKLYPEFPMKASGADNGGPAQSYANALNSWNHFRDHSCGSEITRDTYNGANDADITSKIGDNNHTGSYAANVTRRLYGRLFCGDTHSEEIYGAGLVNSSDATRGKIVSGLFLVPHDFRDVSSLKIGDRVKVGIGGKDWSANSGGSENSFGAKKTADIHESASTAAQMHDVSTQDEKNISKNVNYVNEHKTYLYVTGIGPHYIARQSADTDATSAKAGSAPLGIDWRYLPCVVHLSAGVNPNSGNRSLDRWLFNPAEPSNLETFGEKRGNDLLGTYNTGTDTQPLATVTQIYAANKGQVGYLDVVPDDSRFYISQSFETHESHEELISGSDLTNTVPLHLNLKFDKQGSGSHSDAAQDGDIVTSFINFDAALRIDPTGDITSSM